MNKKSLFFLKGTILLCLLLAGTGQYSRAQSTGLPLLIGKSKYVGPPSPSVFYPADSLQYFMQYDSASYYFAEGKRVCDSIMRYAYYGNWAEFERAYYSYNSNNDTSAWFTELYNSTTHTWNKSGRWSWTFNAAGKEITKAEQLGRSGSAAWEDKTREEYTYDAANRLIKTTGFKSVNGAWVAQGEQTITYNAQGKPLAILAQNLSNGTLVNYTVKEFTYDASGLNNTEEIWRDWNAASAAWTNVARFQRNFSNGGKLLQEQSTLWSDAAQAWKPASIRNSFTYDNAGNLTRKLVEQNSSTTSLNFVNWREYKYTYNSTNQPLTEILLVANNNHVFSIGNNASFTRYYYQEMAPTGIGNSKKGGVLLAVYPNPAVNELHINLKWSDAQPFTATLTDMAGRVYTSYSGPAAKEFRTTWPLGAIPSGNFLLTIRSSNGQEASQMVTISH